MKIEFVIDDVPPTLNTFYSNSMHWSKRKKIAKQWHKYVKDICKEHNIKPIKIFPIEIITQCRFKFKRKRDTSNNFVCNKMIEDGLVEAHIIEDDSNFYVTRHIVEEPLYGYYRDETKVIINIGVERSL